jgi:hypothetical protein
MRTLVVGPYPPSADPVAAAVLRHVRDLRASGDECEALSLTPSAAPHHADLTRTRGALTLGRLTRGRGRVVVHYTSEIAPGPGPDAVRRLTLLAWRRALDAVAQVEVIVHRLDAGDDGALFPVLASCGGRFTAVDGSVAAKLETRGLGLPPVAVDGTYAPVSGTAPTGASWPAGVRELQAAVVDRAAVERADRHGTEAGRLRASSPVRVSLPTSTRPGLTTVRRLLQRLTAWEMDPLVGQVNRLRGAVLDLLDNGGPAGPAPDPDPGGGDQPAASSSGTAARTAARNDAPSTGQS